MFNSVVLEVAIGTIFLFLLLSLLCSAAGELIELLLKKRAIDLERGIRELLLPGSKSGADDLVCKLYNHPLINGLFAGSYQDSGIARSSRYLRATKLPPYIPARNFALALIDLAATQQRSKGDEDSTHRAKSSKSADADSFSSLRAALLQSPLLAVSPQARTALLALFDAAENDLKQARANIEHWYNSSMSSVSSWYKHRAQVVILILGLLAAVAVNVDAITVVRRLSTDKPLRELLTGVAQELAQSNVVQGSDAVRSKVASPLPHPPNLTRECERDAKSAQCARSKELQQFALCLEDVNSAECRYEANLLRLQGLGLPVGWNTDVENRWPGWRLYGSEFWSEWSKLTRIHGLGWLLTALAISLGAPLWFDLLNKFMVVRSVIKPREVTDED